MAATLDYKITRFGVPTGNNLLSFPLGASVTVAGGALAITDAGGNILDASGTISAADQVWGVIYERRPLLTDAVSSVAGTYLVPVECGAFYLQNGGSAADTLTQANIGQTVYVTGEQSVGLTSGAGATRPIAGTLQNIDTTQPGGYAIKIVNQGP
jgi:hypothetical protein